MARGASLELDVSFDADVFMMKQLIPFGGLMSEHPGILNLLEP